MYLRPSKYVDHYAPGKRMAAVGRPTSPPLGLALDLGAWQLVVETLPSDACWAGIITTRSPTAVHVSSMFRPSRFMKWATPGFCRVATTKVRTRRIPLPITPLCMKRLPPLCPLIPASRRGTSDEQAPIESLSRLRTYVAIQCRPVGPALGTPFLLRPGIGGHNCWALASATPGRPNGRQTLHSGISTIARRRKTCEFFNIGESTETPNPIAFSANSSFKNPDPTARQRCAGTPIADCSARENRRV